MNESNKYIDSRINYETLIYKAIGDVLMQSIMIGIAISYRGKYVYASNSLITMFNYTNLDEFTGTNLEDIYTFMSRPYLKYICSTLSSNNSTSSPLRLYGLRKDGSTFEALVFAYQIEYFSKPVLLSFVIDMSFQENPFDQALRLARIEAFGMLARGVAHEINNIIGVLSGNIELISISLPKLSPDSIYFEQAIAACKRGKELSVQLFRLAPKNIEEPILVSLGLSVNEALQFLKPAIPKFIRIIQKNEIPPEEDLVHANPTQLFEMLVDLCENAIHAMREKEGVIEIGLRNIDLDSESAEKLDFGLLPGRYLRLSLKDMGHGIDPSLTTRIFHPFFSTKGTGEGIGLGLTIALATMQKLGGAITVESELGKGSTFYLFFPRQVIDLGNA